MDRGPQGPPALQTTSRRRHIDVVPRLPAAPIVLLGPQPGNSPPSRLQEQRMIRGWFTGLTISVFGALAITMSAADAGVRCRCQQPDHQDRPADRQDPRIRLRDGRRQSGPRRQRGPRGQRPPVPGPRARQAHAAPDVFSDYCRRRFTRSRSTRRRRPSRSANRRFIFRCSGHGSIRTAARNSQ